MSLRLSPFLLACLSLTQANAGDAFNDYRSYYLSKEGVIFPLCQDSCRLC